MAVMVTSAGNRLDLAALPVQILQEQGVYIDGAVIIFKNGDPRARR